MTLNRKLLKYELPTPGFVDTSRVNDLFMVPYQQRMMEASSWAKDHQIQNAALDKVKVAAVGIDVQITFIHQLAQLVVRGALDDTQRTADFIYRNIRWLTRLYMTMDTHDEWQIFHPLAIVDGNGNPPIPGVPIADADIQAGKWRMNPAFSYANFGVPGLTWVRDHLKHYSGKLEERNKRALEGGIEAYAGVYPYIPWPFHGILGGIEHALMPIVHEASFVHSVARGSKTMKMVKGTSWGDEAYSPFGGEVQVDARGKPMGQKNVDFFKALQGFDAIIVYGQAKSHCLRAFVGDLLTFIRQFDQEMAKRVFLVEDLTSPVFIPKQVAGTPDDIDFGPEAETAFQAFRDMQMNVVRSVDPLHTWGGPFKFLEALA